MYQGTVTIAEGGLPIMIRTNLLQPSEARKIVDQRGMYTLVEYEKDLSVRPEFAAEAYFASQMNVRKRQVVANLTGQTGVILQQSYRRKCCKAKIYRLRPSGSGTHLPIHSV